MINGVEEVHVKVAGLLDKISKGHELKGKFAQEASVNKNSEVTEVQKPEKK